MKSRQSMTLLSKVSFSLRMIRKFRLLDPFLICADEGNSPDPGIAKPKETLLPGENKSPAFQEKLKIKNLRSSSFLKREALKKRSSQDCRKSWRFNNLARLQSKSLECQLLLPLPDARCDYLSWASPEVALKLLKSHPAPVNFTSIS